MRGPISARLEMQRMRKAFASAAIVASLSVESLAGCSIATNTTLMRRDAISHLISGSERSDDANAALDAMQRYGTRHSAAVAGRVPEFYSRAGTLIGQLGLHDDASTRLNVAYAIAAIGESRAAELNRRMGIQYFIRYSPEMLENVYATINRAPDTRPMLVVAFNKADHNGAFYREGMALDQILSNYRIILFETATEGDYYSRIRGISSDYGRIETHIIAGHGEPGSITLGLPEETGRLDLTDLDELRAIRDSFGDHPLVILISCSTGESNKAVGATISRALAARVIAPITPSSLTTYQMENGVISGVTFNVETRSFVDGVSR